MNEVSVLLCLDLVMKRMREREYVPVIQYIEALILVCAYCAIETRRFLSSDDMDGKKAIRNLSEQDISRCKTVHTRVYTSTILFIQRSFFSVELYQFHRFQGR